jgi:hypothetical protein
MFPSPSCDSAAKATLDRLLERSRRHSGIQLPPSFVRGTAVEPAPLARMLQGGRGADVRIKLYVTTVLLAGNMNKHPQHGSNVIHDVAAPSWARALALEKPATDGARQVAAAQTWLHKAHLLKVSRRPGREPIVQLRSADGSGRKWRRPTTPYVSVPIGLWSGHWIWALTAKELAVLIALLDLQGGRGSPESPEPQWMTIDDVERYGFSDDTWRLASKALARKSLITTGWLAGAHRDFETRRRRKTYWVNVSRLEDDALEMLSKSE